MMQGKWAVRYILNGFVCKALWDTTITKAYLLETLKVRGATNITITLV